MYQPKVVGMRTALNFKTSHTLQGSKFREFQERFFNLETAECVCDTVLIANSSFFWSCILRKELIFEPSLQAVTLSSKFMWLPSLLISFLLEPSSHCPFCGVSMVGLKRKIRGAQIFMVIIIYRANLWLRLSLVKIMDASTRAHKHTVHIAL